MIDIENVKKEFKNYVSQFNPNEGRIKLKIDHIQRVAEISKKIAINLKLNDEQIKLAEVIGIFHDIGRFKQVEMYNTFSDKDSINHGELGVKVLYEDNLIQKFKIDEKYNRIIKCAILNHNRAKIEDNLTDEELLFSKIIRDADKLDIYYTICEYDFKSIFWYKDFDCQKISEKIMENLRKSELIDYKDIKNNADVIAIFYAYIYDFNFKFSLKYIKDGGYLEKFASRVIEEFKSDIIKNQMQEILEISKEYINKIS